MIKARRDVFSARFIYNGLAWLKNVPYFIEVGDTYPEEVVNKYFYFKLVTWLCVNLGITIYQRFKSNQFKFVYYDKFSGGGNGNRVKYYFKIGILFFLLGIIVKLYTIFSIGGIMYILIHLQARKSLMEGFYYNEMIATTFLTLSVILIELYWLAKSTFRSKMLFFIVFIVAIMNSMVFGARKPALDLLLLVLMTYHFCGSKLSIRGLFKPKSLLVIGILIMYMVMIPMLRLEKESKLIDNPKGWVEAGLENISSISHEFSYMEGEMFVFEYFDNDNIWLGRPYANIFLQWIPRSLYPNKPPMDDGMYLVNMMYGQQVTPDMSPDDMMYDTSEPFTMEGALYANFGFLGLVFGGFIIGLLYQFSYKLLIDTGAAILTLIIYREIVFTFVPSVLHTTSPLIKIVISGILLVPLLSIRIKIENNAVNTMEKK